MKTLTTTQETQETKARKEAKKKLRKRPKWKLREEQSQLMEVQRILRMRLEKCDEAVAKLRNAEILALKKGDDEQVSLIEAMIKQYELESTKMEKRYKNNGEILKLYSEVLKNNREGGATVLNSLFAAGGVVASGALAAIGLKKSFQSDMEGTMTNRKTFDWIKSLPIVRNFGSGRK